MCQLWYFRRVSCGVSGMSVVVFPVCRLWYFQCSSCGICGVPVGAILRLQVAESGIGGAAGGDVAARLPARRARDPEGVERRAAQDEADANRMASLRGNEEGRLMRLIMVCSFRVLGLMECSQILNDHNCSQIANFNWRIPPKARACAGCRPWRGPCASGRGLRAPRSTSSTRGRRGRSSPSRIR